MAIQTVIADMVMPMGDKPLREMSSQPPASRGEGDETADEFDDWAAMRVVGQRTRAGLLADIVGHPKGMPSVPELNYTNPRVERSTVIEHLEKLMNAGVVGKAELPPGERHRDLPYTFYYVTEAGREFLDRNNVLDEEVWSDQYDRVEKTPAIREIEAMERPGRD